MNQRTHSWIAIRAIALLDDEGAVPELVKLLKPHACMASIGAWVPDDTDAKRGDAGALTENHILKMEPYTGPDPDRFVTRKDTLLERLGPHRKVADFLQNDETLPDEWWSAPYKGDVDKPGKHLPNRAMALSTMLKDLILMGNPAVQKLLPGAAPRFLKWMDETIQTEDEAVAMYFFMLSHFVADVSMPCHCDARRLAGYSNGLHKELEAHWSKQVGTVFEKKNLLPDPAKKSRRGRARALAGAKEVLNMARDTGAEFGIDFTGSVPDLHAGHDVWLELIYCCRASFAVDCVLAPPSRYPFDSPAARASFDTVFGNGDSPLLRDIDAIAMHDAVLNTAVIWKHTWTKVSR